MNLNNYVQKRLTDIVSSKTIRIANQLRDQLEVLSTFTDETILSIYDKCISIRQQNIQSHGCHLESIVRDILMMNNIQFKEQVEINEKGIIIGIGSKTKKCFHIIDFVIGNVSLLSSITNYQVLSCKTTCRERWTQDNWSLTLKPTKYILITTSDDYPPSLRFVEGTNRKIITLKNKKKDDRVYKISFNNLIEEVMLPVENCVFDTLSNYKSEICGNCVTE
jgi:hypothetical protein